MSRRVSMLVMVFVFVFTMVFYMSIGTVDVKASVSGIVTRQGSQLMLNGQPFTFAGMNMHWLVSEDCSGYGSRLTPSFQVDDGMAAAKEMGATVVRTFMPFGYSFSPECALDTYSEDGLRALDYAVKAAGDNGIRLMIALIDYNDWRDQYGGMGGRKVFTDWFGISDVNQFYYDRRPIDAFKRFISTILNRTNYYTGVVYKNDPAIFGWQTGNEMWDAPVAWSTEISGHIKSIDANHLVIDGYLDWRNRYHIASAQLSISSIDVYDLHSYPMSTDSTYFAADARSANKAAIIGEYGWSDSGQSGGTDLSNFLNNVAQPSVGFSGAMFWELFPHRNGFGFALHSQGYAAQYPVSDWKWPSANTSYPDKAGLLQTIRSYCYTVTGRSVPLHGTPGTPIITSVVYGVGNNRVISWRGASIAKSYTVERSTTGPNGPWTVLVDKGPNDFGTPWTDTTAPSGPVYYRVKGWNYDGSIAGNYSNVYMHPDDSLLRSSINDSLNDFSKMHAVSPNLNFDGVDFPTSNWKFFGGDFSRVNRTTVSTNPYDYIVYKTSSDMASFLIDAYFWPSEPVVHNKIYTSPDNVNYTELTPTITDLGGNWDHIQYTSSSIPSGTRYLKIEFRNTSSNYWTPEISNVQITGKGGQIVDNMTDFSKMYYHSTNLGFDTTPSDFQYFNGLTSTLVRTNNNGSNIVYGDGNKILTSFNMDTYFWPGEGVTNFSFWYSPDNVNWYQITPTVTNLGGNWTEVKYSSSLPAGTKYLSIWFPTTANYWNPHVGSVVVNYN